MKQGYIILIMISAALGQIFAQTQEEIFYRGNELYRSGNYQAAAKEYESIINQGYISAELYFNLGNAYYRNEQLGRAILSYERAAVLHPNDPDIEHNLKLVNLKTVDRIEPVPDLFLVQWMRLASSMITLETIKILFVISWILLFGSLVVMYLVLRPGVFKIARIFFFTSFVLVVLCILMIGMQIFQDSSQNKAIITAPVVTAKSSPDEKSVDAFVVHEGLKVKLSDAVGGWVKVTLVDGKVGWILSSQCEKI